MEMEKRLYEATVQGNIPNLESLLQQDPLLLHRISPSFFQFSPLHLAILHGHLEYARVLLTHNPQLTTESDSLGQLPLHLASANGQIEIVSELLSVDTSACLARDKDGKVPLHLAVMKGARVEVVNELARASPESTRMKVERGDILLHLCVKNERFDALKVLVELLRSENNGSNLMNAKNDDGNTILHLAALCNNLEITKFLLATPEIDPNAMNNNGLTPLNLVENSPKHINTLEQLNLLLQSNIQKPTKTHNSPYLQPTKSSLKPSKNKSWKTFFTFNNNNINQLQHMKGELLITSAIIALIHASPIIYLRINDPKLLDIYSINFGSFVPAVTIIAILLGGFPLQNKLCSWFVIQLMYSAVGCLAYGSYFGNMISFESRYSKLTIPIVLMFIWFLLLIVLSALNVIRLIVLLVKNFKGWTMAGRLRSTSENVM
ncbi:ankyrin repeat-containing protein BDA1-like [Amaranthus tricolor]|uniref:ankyrin repeat-containing protein BDA1-like n=1 Tax=Amaranthus tricolor TaxID=29722 RepID=UPI0025837E95|nr:ankyrin repeat-containing protein BDA1-like [Amaranthus tricolor]